MKLYEYQAKSLLRDFGILVPEGKLFEIGSEIDLPKVFKIQTHQGKRGKAGGVKFIENQTEANEFLRLWQDKEFSRGELLTPEIVKSILVEEPIDIEKEIYLVGFVDRGRKILRFNFSTDGGVEIEDSVSHIHSMDVDISMGAMPFMGRRFANLLGINGELSHKLASFFIKFIEFFIKNNCLFLEINPLVITKKGEVICLDCKIDIDDNAINCGYLDHINIEKIEEAEYLDFQGNIGCIVNGAGLAMATIDMVIGIGGNPANFMDIGGGGDTYSKICEALEKLQKKDEIDVLFINIFGGIVDCEQVANAMIDSLSKETIKIVARLKGNNYQSATIKLANQHQIFVVEELPEALERLKKLI